MRLSKLAKKYVRTTDVLARWGGEEFMIILPETSANDAYEVATKLRIAIENTTLTKSNCCTITASFGVTGLNEDDTNSSLLKRVDEALYDAKHNGRNQVIIK